MPSSSVEIFFLSTIAPTVPDGLIKTRKWSDLQKPALTPRELSEKAITNIKANPFSHQQRAWHSKGTRPNSQFIHPCGTAHCYAGHIDLLIGVPNDYKENNLYNDVESALGLSFGQFREITDPGNTIARIEALHRAFFVDGIYGEGGFDADGKNRDMQTRNDVELEQGLDLSPRWWINES